MAAAILVAAWATRVVVQSVATTHRALHFINLLVSVSAIEFQTNLPLSAHTHCVNHSYFTRTCRTITFLVILVELDGVDYCSRSLSGAPVLLLLTAIPSFSPGMPPSPSSATSSNYPKKPLQRSSVDSHLTLETDAPQLPTPSIFSSANSMSPAILSIITGDEGQYTQWVHCDLIVGSETICLAHT